MYGRMGNVRRSPYVLSKYAVEGFTDCLRQEMRSWGVAVSLIEPGNYIAATNVLTDDKVKGHGKAMWDGMSQEVREAYTQQYFDATVENLLTFAHAGCRDVTAVVEAMTSALTQASPRARYMPIDAANYLRLFINTHLPEYFYDTFCTSTASHHPTASS